MLHRRARALLNAIHLHRRADRRPQALHRLVESYLTLGLKDEATRVAAVLGYNYPGNRWYQDSYKLLDPQQRQKILEDRDWLDKTVESLFKPD